MLKKILLIIFLLVVFVSSGFAQEARVEFEGRYWVTDLDAKAKAVESNIGTDFNLKDDLGIKDEDYPEARVIWHTGPNSQLRLAYTQVDYSGAQDIARTIEFEGKSYTAGTRVNSEFDLKYLSFGWIWKFINIAEGKIKLGSILGVKGLYADISLEAPNLSPPVSESEQFFGGLPTIGVALDINPIKKVNLFAEISGLTAGEYGYFFDAEAGLRIIPIKNFSIAGGYRIIDIKAEDDPDFVKVEITGPFVSATLRF